MTDISALWLTFQLASITTLLLLLVGTPLAWWLAHSRSWLRTLVEAVVALPLVLPPTVLGFYLLLLLSPNAPLGAFWLRMTETALTFSFEGLVLASMIYSLPFMVQPLRAAFETLEPGLMEAAASLRAGPLDRFVTVALPLSLPGFVAAGILTFAHTLGEFGVVLMVGGNIAGETRVVSIAIYEQVETLNYAAAHQLSLILVCFSFVVLLLSYAINRRWALVKM